MSPKRHMSQRLSTINAQYPYQPRLFSRILSADSLFLGTDIAGSINIFMTIDWNIPSLCKSKIRILMMVK
jgi:hypothetical protein